MMIIYLVMWIGEDEGGKETWNKEFDSSQWHTFCNVL